MPKHIPMKRLVICCDGTWMDSNNGTNSVLDPIKALAAELTGKVSLQTPSNVTRIGRCVKSLDTDHKTPIQQISYYQVGLGSQNLEDKVLGGATGYGLSEHIREAYQFIAANYNHDAVDADGDGIIGDEIFLIGFSRGAFTARSIASFINDVGLLTRIGMMHFYTIFADWENQQKKGWKVPFEDDPFPGHHEPEYSLFDEAGRKRYVEELVKRKMTVPNVKIKAVAVWDTVGSLGIPRLGIFNTMNHESLDYAFVDTSVPDCIVNAIHAISLDEDRKPFMPTIWEKPGPGQTLNQVWFSGAHADVGGSYDDTRAADITLVWMVSQLAKFDLVFDDEVLQKQFFKPQGEEPHSEKSLPPWGCGPIHNEYKGFYFLADSLTRSPMAYLRYDHYTGLPIVPHQELENTNEKVHSSVRVRFGNEDGKDYEGKPYASLALKGWRVEGTAKDGVVNGGTHEITNELELSGEAIRKGQRAIAWKNGAKQMPEAELSDLEWKFIRSFKPDIAAKFLTITPRP